MSGEAIPLSAEDRAILDLECGTIAGHTCKVIVLGAGAPDVGTLRALVAERIDRAPELTRGLGGTPHEPAWVRDPGFDLDRHVVAPDSASPLDEPALRAAVAELFSQRLKVPVSLHHEGDDAGNRDSFFALGLPLAEPDPVVRLQTIHAEAAERKADHDAEGLDELLRGLAGVSPHLARFCEKLERSPRRFALNVSNVPGPPREVGVLGAPVIELHTIAEIGEHHALRVAVLSYAGELCFGLCGDPGVVQDLDVLAAGIEAEAAELIGRS